MCPGGKDRKWAPREYRAKPGGWVLLWSRPSYKHQAYQPPQLPDRGEVQTGGMSRAEATSCQRNLWRFSLAQYHPLRPTPRARVTLKAHCEQVELENGVSLTFPLHYLQNLFSIFFSWVLGCSVSLLLPTLNPLPLGNSIAFPAWLMLSWVYEQLNEYRMLGYQTDLSQILALPLRWAKNDSYSLFSHLQNRDNITNLIGLWKEW